MKRKIIWAAFFIGFFALLENNPTKTVKRNTSYGWQNIVDEDGDGTVDVVLTPSGRGYIKEKPTTEDQKYFSENKK